MVPHKRYWLSDLKDEKATGKKEKDVVKQDININWCFSNLY